MVPPVTRWKRDTPQKIMMTGGRFLSGWMVALCALNAPLAVAADGDDALLHWLRRSNAVWSPHEVAAFGDSADDVKRALQACPQHLNAVDEQGNTPLHLAVRAGKVAVVAAFLEAGADACAKDAQGRMPIELAQHADMVALLEKYVTGRNAELQLCSAVRAGDVAAARAALAAGVSPNARDAELDGPVLCVAVLEKNVEMVEMLLAAGAGTEVELPHGKTLLHLAAAAGSVEVLRVLQKNGLSPVAVDEHGVTPLHEAVWAKNTATLQELLPAYAEQNFSPRGKHVGTPIEMAIAQSRADYVQLFLNAGINVNDARFHKNPLLHTAARMDKPFIVKMLLDAGADKNAVDAEGKRAVEYAKGEAAQLLK